MKTPHTPAPWILGNPLPEENRIQIMHKEAPRPDDIAPTWVVANANLCMGEESEANARLIAAAPELLAALQDVKEWILRDEESLDFGQVSMSSEMLNERFQNVRDAIAKATWEAVE